MNLCKYLGDEDFTENNIEKMFRLGKRTGNTRPLKVCLDEMTTKYKIIRNTSLLRESEEFSRISIQHDLTPEQRDEVRELVQLAKKKETDDTSGNFIYRVRGPPGRKFIKKLRKRVEVEADTEMPPVVDTADKFGD